MAITFYATNNFTGNGSTTLWNIHFADGYISADDVKARYLGPTGEYLDIPINSVAGNVVTISPARPAGEVFQIYRDTEKSFPLVDFSDGAILNEANLDVMAKQSVMVAAEAMDRSNALIVSSDTATAEARAALLASGNALNLANDAKTQSAQAAADAAIASASAVAANTAAQTAATSAQSAQTNASTALSTANTAKTTADAAKVAADSAKATATSATTTANTALSTANTAKTTADTAISTANTASTTSANAKTTADTAIATANAANTTATGIDAKATQALSAANAANTAAGNAVTTANGVDAKATQAMTKATAAETTATAAQTTANSVDAKATQAQTDATAAKASAAAADAKATTAQNTAVLAQAAAAGRAAAGANSDITSLSGLTTAITVAQGGTGSTSLDAFKDSANIGPNSAANFRNVTVREANATTTGNIIGAGYTTFVQRGSVDTSMASYGARNLATGVSEATITAWNVTGGRTATLGFTDYGDLYGFRDASGTSVTCSTVTGSTLVTGGRVTMTRTGTMGIYPTGVESGTKAYLQAYPNTSIVNKDDTTSAINLTYGTSWCKLELPRGATSGTADYAKLSVGDSTASKAVRFNKDGSVYLTGESGTLYKNSKFVIFPGKSKSDLLFGNPTIAGSIGHFYNPGDDLTQPYEGWMLGSSVSYYGDFTGNVQIHIRDSYNLAKYYFQANGNLGLRSGNTDYSFQKSATSDADLKHSIVYSDVEQAIANIKAMKPATFVYNFDDRNRVRRGFIAQDLQLIDPDYVRRLRNADGEESTLVLDSNPLLMDALITIKHLLARVEALEELVTAPPTV